MSLAEYLYKNENMDNINDKTSPNQMRVLMKRIREGKYEPTEASTTKKDLDMRSMLKLTRNLNEDVMVDDNTETKELPISKKTAYDQRDEEDKFIKYFQDADIEISPKFEQLEVYTNPLWVFWGGEVDGIMVFVYSVTADEATSVWEIDYLPDFSPDAPKNELIAKLIETYYEIFKDFWRDELMQD